MNMNESERAENEEGEVVTVTKSGQATIPKKFRDKLDISPSEKVRFRETEKGEVVVERVPSPSEMRGIASENSKTDKPATEILQEKREQDKKDLKDE
jgi:AbrB family looped-hinge helix DNA binding protein